MRALIRVGAPSATIGEVAQERARATSIAGESRSDRIVLSENLGAPLDDAAFEILQESLVAVDTDWRRAANQDRLTPLLDRVVSAMTRRTLPVFTRRSRHVDRTCG